MIGDDLVIPAEAGTRHFFEEEPLLANQQRTMRMMRTKDRDSDRGWAITALQERVREFCEARDWDQFHGPKDLAIGVITEASELLERFRFLTDDQGMNLLADPRSREEIEDELADVMFFLLRFAQRFDVDLGNALARKIDKNEKKYPVGTSRGDNRKSSRK